MMQIGPMSQSSSKNTTVLVVEDEPLIRMNAVDLLEDAGFTVLEAQHAEDAIELLKIRLDVRIIFTDIDMPGEMDGIKLASFVRNRWPPIQIIVTSGRMYPAPGALPHGSMFLPKPYTGRQIVAAIRDFCG